MSSSFRRRVKLFRRRRGHRCQLGDQDNWYRFALKDRQDRKRDKTTSRVETRRDGTARKQGETFLRKESCRWKRSQSLAGTRLESDLLYIAMRAVPLTEKDGMRGTVATPGEERERHATKNERRGKRIV